ncbi:hypothetical protein Ahy_A03g015973 [Arachis hypogaea]|uniref:Uncharacterized protein n=1 Tax=Arachis hypogaea TaxID=3818 RepID=A0A445E1Z8_ARAHY|nr:hypothetical protein Ahy_A03g015973 [Arachis hypogaea]
MSNYCCKPQDIIIAKDEQKSKVLIQNSLNSAPREELPNYLTLHPFQYKGLSASLQIAVTAIVPHTSSVSSIELSFSLSHSSLTPTTTVALITITLPFPSTSVSIQ